ncbi:MAG: nucleotidyltransferase family protein [Ignavibacteriales bacterium]|nr:nucleotidyltransferase family protein [Ignavibacteriales bacterium]
MKALIFAAGLGTRLKPLTDNKPKALVEVKNIPLLELAITKLKYSGIDEIIINVHHFADMIVDFLKRKNNFGINIAISDESDLLLDTGGGLKKAAWFFDNGKPFLVYNVDVFSNIDLNKLYQTQLTANSIATLAVRNRATQRYLLFDDDNILCGWKNIKTGETKIARQSSSQMHPLANSGIQIINPQIFELMPEENIFSIIELYLKLVGNYKIIAFNHDDNFWLDLGKKENLAEAEKLL